jgi:hypothetical protein
MGNYLSHLNRKNCRAARSATTWTSPPERRNALRGARGEEGGPGAAHALQARVAAPSRGAESAESTFPIDEEEVRRAERVSVAGTVDTAETTTRKHVNPADTCMAGEAAEFFDPLLDGEYLGEIVPGVADYRERAGVKVGTVALNLDTGGGSPRVVRAVFLLKSDKAEHIAGRDVGVLAAWANLVSSRPARGWYGLVENLWVAQRKGRMAVLFDLRTRTDHRGLPEYFVVGVRECV